MKTLLVFLIPVTLMAIGINISAMDYHADNNQWNDYHHALNIVRFSSVALLCEIIALVFVLLN